MRKLFFLLPLLLLAWCTMPWISLDRWDEKVDYFEKDALCQNYIDEIKAEATKYDNEVASTSNFSAFYSPTLNQCFVSYSEYYNAHKEWYEEYSTYTYQATSTNDFCSFKLWTQESRLMCTENMYYDKTAPIDENDIIPSVRIQDWPKSDMIINHMTQEEKYLRW